MKWISVSDQLPDTQEAVLVFCGKSMRVARFRQNEWMLCGSFHELYEGEGLANKWDWDATYLSVSHWQPLPKPPKK